MPTRFRPGDYLIIDQMSGLEIWASDSAVDWDGNIRDANDLDGQHPEYVKRIYPIESYPTITNPAAPVPAYVPTVPGVVGLTTVSAPPGIAPDRFIV